jgi:hypothetical protein
MTSRNATSLVLDTLILKTRPGPRPRLIPGAARAATAAAFDKLTASASRLDITNMGRLCRDITVILRHAAQITKITGPLRSADAHRLHALRNTALAWAIVCVLRIAALDRLRRANGIKCAGACAMVDAGATPVETTANAAGLDAQPPSFMLIPHVTAAIVDRGGNLDR